MKESYKSTTRGAIYRKSRYRITAFCALVTGLVLLIAFAVAWQAARRQMSNADESLFLSQCQTVTAYVSSPYGVDTQTVLQFAGQNQLAVAVVDGGTLLTFVPDLQKETLTQLLCRHLQLGEAYTLPQRKVGISWYSPQGKTGGASCKGRRCPLLSGAIYWLCNL